MGGMRGRGKEESMGVGKKYNSLRIRGGPGVGRTERKGSTGGRKGERELLAARHHRDHFSATNVAFRI